MDGFEEQREKMVREQIAARGIRDPRVLAAMREIPRHCFVHPDLWKHAYDDAPLPTQQGQTISQPYIVALMTFLLHLSGTEKVLEIGTGSGYQAAVLSRLARQVYTIEIIADLAEHARRVLDELNISNVEVLQADGSGGLPEQAPFEGILLTAAAPYAPQPLLDQLTLQGRLVLPVGDREGQELQVWERLDNGGFDLHRIAPVLFVPLRGAYGWKEGEWEA